jgi:hypothetical protein
LDWKAEDKCWENCEMTKKLSKEKFLNMWLFFLPGDDMLSWQKVLFGVKLPTQASSIDSKRFQSCVENCQNRTKKKKHQIKDKWSFSVSSIQ